MRTHYEHDRATRSVVTTLADGRVVRLSFGDFLHWQKREAVTLRETAIDAAISGVRRRLRRLRRRAVVRLGRMGRPAHGHAALAGSRP
ncbi:MAG: hypothetical protein V4792_01770 [Pseudomonadota bacterium]